MGNEILIPWSRPHFWGNEESYVLDALHSTWISGGRFVETLEREFARYNGSTHAVTTSNGTTALHLAYLGIGIDKGDEIIVPGYAFMAAANVAAPLPRAGHRKKMRCEFISREPMMLNRQPA